MAPQLYWHIGFKVADYTVLLDWWSKHTYGRHLYIGQAAYRIGGKGWEDSRELSNQVNLNRNYDEVKGSIYFNSKTFLEDKLSINAEIRSLYPHAALIPTMSWIDAVPAEAPHLEGVAGNFESGLSLSWKDAIATDASYYVVYRFDKGNLVSADNPSNIVGVVARGSYGAESWRGTTAATRTTYTYAITAVDRSHNESTLSNPITIKIRGKSRAIKIP